MTTTWIRHGLGVRPKALLVKSIPGVLNWTRVCITPFQPGTWVS
jgi:hypothetical protein